MITIVRKGFGVAFILGIALFLIGCQETEEVGDEEWVEDDVEPIQEEEENELTLRHMFYPDFEEDYHGTKLRAMFDRIEEEQELTIVSDSQSIDGYTAVLADDLSRGELPHIMEFHVSLAEDVTFIHEHTEDLLDLTDFLEESGLIEAFYSLDQFTVDGRVYGLPVYSGGMTQLYYNKELVEELGGIPETLQEFIDTMKQAKQAGYNPIVLDMEGDYGFSQYPYELIQGILLETAGKEKLHALMNGEATWTDNEFVEAFQLMEEIAQIEIQRFDMYPDGLLDEFLAGNSVFMYSNFMAIDSAGDTFGVMQFPAASEEKERSGMLMGTFPFGYVFNGNVTEEEEQMIYQFIESLWSQEMMTEYYLDEYLVPAIRVEANTDATLFNETITLMNETPAIIPGISGLVPNVEDYTSEQYEYEVTPQDEYTWTLTDVVNQVLEGNITTPEAVEKMNVLHENIISHAQIQ